MTAIPRERLDMRIDAETKSMAERAAAALGCASLTEFMVRLIRENAPKILEHEAKIQLTNAQFDRFLEVCDDVRRGPSPRLRQAARRLDTEGL
jgi:uncharacterized protein (DUF1778 family)